EICSSSPQKNSFKPTYFPEGRSLWADAGLPGAQLLADRVNDGSAPFDVLDAAQLLKHMLGLQSGGQPWSLCCLWYDVGGEISQMHQRDLDRFSSDLGADRHRFWSQTYQQFFNRISVDADNEHKIYVSYLRDRYFP